MTGGQGVGGQTGGMGMGGGVQPSATLFQAPAFHACIACIPVVLPAMSSGYVAVLTAH